MKLLALSIVGPDGNTVSVQTPAGTPDISVLTNLPQFIITLILGGVILLSIIFIIVSGIQWMLSGGDEKKIEGARNRLTYAIIGLVIAVSAFLIVSVVIQLLGLDPSQFGV